jgi:hypothetical protein
MTQTFFVSSSTMIAIGHLAFLLSHTLISVPVQYVVASATTGDANSTLVFKIIGFSIVALFAIPGLATAQNPPSEKDKIPLSLDYYRVQCGILSRDGLPKGTSLCEWLVESYDVALPVNLPPSG